MTNDPAKYIVMSEKYAQISGYPEFCTSIVKSLVEEIQPTSARELVDYIQQQMKALAQNAAGFQPVHTDEFGWNSYRSHTVLTPLFHETSDLRYAQNVLFFQSQKGEEVLSEAWNKKIIMMPVKQGNESVDLPLSAFLAGTNYKGNHFLTHLKAYTNPHPEEDSWPSHRSEELDRLHWDLTCKEFDLAINSSTNQNNKEDAGPKFFNLLSHYGSVQNGVATLTRIALGYVEEVVGFDVALCPKGIDLHVQALFRTPQEFLEDYRSGSLSDRSLTSKEVIEWHKTVALNPSLYEARHALNRLTIT